MEGINLAEELKNLANEIKDKWINIRCTEEQRQDVTEFAKQCNMAVSELFWHLVAKEMKLTNEIESIRRREKRTTISEREKEALRYFVAKERK